MLCKGEIAYDTFILDVREREIISWRVVARADIGDGDIRDMTLEAVDARFGGCRAQKPYSV